MRRLLEQPCYYVGFSLLYALVLSFSFYPGILYSDSYGRWKAAIGLATDGLDAISYIDTRSPLAPLIFMTPAYSLSGEIGLFHFCQSFLFSLTLFRFARVFSKSWLTMLVTSLVLLLPINFVYSVFSSYDSLLAIILLNVFILLYKFEKNLFDGLLLATLIAVAIGTRFPAVLMLPVLLFAMFRLRDRYQRFSDYVTSISATIVLTTVVLLTPSVVNFRQPQDNKSMAWNANPLFDGIAWEYQNFATKWSSPDNDHFLARIGLSKEDLRDFSYSSILDNGWSGQNFIDRIPASERWNLLRLYTRFALENPALFVSEKAKYVADLMGLYKPIRNYEIGKWRDAPWWMPAFEELGFKSNARKERLIDIYFGFMTSIGSFFLRPILVFTFLFGMALVLRRREKAVLYSVGAVTVYYLAYAINSPSHELRYFYPVAYLFMGCLPPFVALSIEAIHYRIAGALHKFSMPLVPLQAEKSRRLEPDLRLLPLA